ncbi:polysaccharide deacetylase family protein [Actinomadura graeca]|uniref:Polysaccharide deacetylase family protein n=1 Tax=Actinomadura graeca TaxID=2750812 RepID=A0ABX8QP25_9ACTN|nr:polysaccharide deacetylase family protein [Actinomadura graeca]QXJ20358.1 polysaccharide deacetylase family protein [Actinomadura graeca]
MIVPRVRVAAAASAALLAALPLASCAGEVERRGRRISDDTAVRSVDPTAVAGLTAQTRFEQDTTRRVYAAYPRVPGANALTKRLAAVVEEQVRPFTALTTSAPPLADGGVPELNVQWSLTAASRQVVGVRLVTWQYLGVSGGEARQTLWYDGATRTAHTSADLIDGRAGLTALAERVRDRLGSRANPAQVRADEATFPSLAFNEAGDMVVEFGDYTVAPGSAGRVAVTLPRSVYDPMLSPFGRRARDAALATPARPTTTAPELAAARPVPGPVDCSHAKCIALTFDDGPGRYTRELLRTLAARRARATFFVVGDNAAADPGLLRDAAAAGNELGNHTQAHRDLTRLPTMQINSDVQRTQDVLRTALGRCPTLLRPPYGATNTTVSSVAKSLDLVQVLWSIDPGDWRMRDPERIASRVVERARPGAVVVLHESRKPTIGAVPRILDRLARQGYSFVTVSELMAGREIPIGGHFSGM